MTIREQIAACELQWQYVGNNHSVCRYCAFVVHVACDATIEDHMKACRTPTPRAAGGRDE